MIYTVKPGDTLYSLSRQFGVPVLDIARLNQIPDPNILVEGQALLILNSIKDGPLTKAVEGYAYPFISSWVLRETLPFLTRLDVFSYGFTPEGDLIEPPITDRFLLQQARSANVPTALVLTPLGRDGQFSNYLISALLQDTAAQEKLLEQLQTVMEEKGYTELNIDFEYIPASDRDRFTAFVRMAQEKLPQIVSVCLAPKMSPTQRGVLFDGKDYEAIGQIADKVLLMTYEWGYKYGPPQAVAPLSRVREVVEYAVSVIPREKILLGLANYGYDWPLPYQRGRTVARTIGSIEAVELAKRERTNIIFDNPSQSPWFQYTDLNGIRHVVWFEDVRSWNKKLDLVEEFGLAGVGIWTVMPWFRPGYELIADRWRAAQ